MAASSGGTTLPPNTRSVVRTEHSRGLDRAQVTHCGALHAHSFAHGRDATPESPQWYDASILGVHEIVATRVARGCFAPAWTCELSPHDEVRSSPVSHRHQDVRHATIDGKPALDVLPKEWLEGALLQVEMEGEIIKK